MCCCHKAGRVSGVMRKQVDSGGRTQGNLGGGGQPELRRQRQLLGGAALQTARCALVALRPRPATPCKPYLVWCCMADVQTSPCSHLIIFVTAVSPLSCVRGSPPSPAGSRAGTRVGEHGKHPGALAQASQSPGQHSIPASLLRFDIKFLIIVLLFSSRYSIIHTTSFSLLSFLLSVLFLLNWYRKDGKYGASIINGSTAPGQTTA